MLPQLWKVAFLVVNLLLCSSTAIGVFQHTAKKTHDLTRAQDSRDAQAIINSMGDVKIMREDHASSSNAKAKARGHTKADAASEKRKTGSASQVMRTELPEEEDPSRKDGVREVLANKGVAIMESAVVGFGDSREDCAWAEWSDWSDCTLTCGTGSRHKKRDMTKEPRDGGRPCDDPLLFRMEETCSTTVCPINCTWSAWNPWTACTVSCAGGRQERIREREHIALHGGELCQGAYREELNCNQFSCPIDCAASEWSEWGNCTEECGGGDRHRRKTITLEPLHGGAECPVTAENMTCNDDVCPIQSGARRLSEVSTIAALFLLVVVLMQMSESS